MTLREEEERAGEVKSLCYLILEKPYRDFLYIGEQISSQNPLLKQALQKRISLLTHGRLLQHYKSGRLQA